MNSKVYFFLIFNFSLEIKFFYFNFSKLRIFLFLLCSHLILNDSSTQKVTSQKNIFPNKPLESNKRAYKRASEQPRPYPYKRLLEYEQFILANTIVLVVTVLSSSFASRFSTATATAPSTSLHLLAAQPKRHQQPELIRELVDDIVRILVAQLDQVRFVLASSRQNYHKSDNQQINNRHG